MLRNPFVRSCLALALLGGVAAWNFKSTADATCTTVCFPAKYVWMKYKNPCLSLNCAYIAASYLDGYSVCHPAGVGGSCICLFRCASCINWTGKCTGHTSNVARDCLGPTVCIGFFPHCRGCRLCPCSGCACLCIDPDKTFYNVSALSRIVEPSGDPLAWIQWNHGKCIANR